MNSDYLLRKLEKDQEKKNREWRLHALEKSLMHGIHELNTLKQLGLEYQTVFQKVAELKREYRHLTGLNYR